jgi:ATP-dependent RNA helicase DDX27
MLENLSKYLVSQGGAGFSSLACFGGSSIKQAKRDLENSPDFIVATTGRLIDHCKNTLGFSLDDVEVLVLDEADRLLEMGFKDELKTILSLCKNSKRQTIMVSATLNQDLKELSSLALKEPLEFTV